MLSCPVQGCVGGEQSISFLVSAVSAMFSVGYTASVYSVLKLFAVYYSGSPIFDVQYKYISIMVVIVGH